MITSGGVYGTPTLIVPLQSPSDDYDPAPAGDYLLALASNRASAHGDIYMALRPAEDKPFGAPIFLSTVNSAESDADPFYHVGLQLLVFSSERSGSPSAVKSGSNVNVHTIAIPEMRDGARRSRPASTCGRRDTLLFDRVIGIRLSETRARARAECGGLSQV